MNSVMDAVNPLKRKPVPAPEPVKPLNHIALLLDESGSMDWLTKKVYDLTQEQIAAIKQAAYGSDQVTKVSIFSFTNTFGSALQLTTHAFETHPEAARLVNYKPSNGTPLNDAIREVTSQLLRAQTGSPQENFLVMVLTDGAENASREGRVTDLIAELQRKGNWTFALMVPPGHKIQTAAHLGIPLANIQEWEQSEEGLRVGSQVTAQATSSYLSNTTKGVRQTAAFYTDASKLKPTVVARKLDDVSKGFRHWKIEAESPISDFVKSKIGSYELGKAYYELTKPETIQSHKDIVLQNRKTKKFFGGEEARKMLGIAQGPGVDVRVRPGNHGDWKIFVKSTSMNRKLVRGTTLLYAK